MLYGLFDDPHVSRFFPLTYSRPFSFLRTGIFTQSDAAALIFGDLVFVTGMAHINSYLESIRHPLSGLPKGLVLVVNSRIKDFSAVKASLSELKTPGDALSDGKTVFAVLLEPGFNPANLYQDPFCVVSNPVFFTTPVFDHTWEIILENGDTQRKQLPMLEPSLTDLTQAYKGMVLGSGRILAGTDVLIHPGVTFDLRGGDVVLDDGAEIMAQASLVAPVYIGKKSKIKIGAKIYQNTAIGPVCKVGGEVEDVIIQGFSNKQHDGFLGHAFLGEWCNLGADTNNSDLKNTYATVDVWENGKFTDTGSQFMGLIMGDHSKTGINTMLNTGTVVGFSSNVFGSGFPDRLIPSFHWSADSRLIEYRMNKAIETAKIVLSRRNQVFSEADEVLFKQIKQIAGIEMSAVRKNS
ncbi:MAG: hypothetical protein L6Q77_05925 [Bacteroidetes bacterium]|nr:hypothetical protein [Bacteroidota bacterium]